ncbi:MAG: hypothetical protein KZQ97_11190 [Candidatus Thiodiazotropha sp. (ex Dulcina madagascariensis)]|nr:hypothetical protein [Candidatus Thiodiazotropha sp. (ex Dulcina madagascariensis)]
MSLQDSPVVGKSTEVGQWVKPGQQVDLEILVDRRRAILKLPFAALREGDEKRVVILNFE